MAGSVGRPVSDDERAIVGRDQVVDGVLEVIAGLDAAVPAGRVVVLDGPSGIGKTTLVEEVRREAVERGHRVVFGRGRELGVHLPNAPLVDAFGEPPALTDDIDGRIDGLQRQWQLITRLTLQLEETAQNQPVLLVVEDLHFVDDDTLTVLGRLVDLVEQLPLVVVLTTRPDPARPAREALLRQVIDDGALHFTLGPLTTAEVDQLVEGRLGQPPGRLLRAVLAHAAGNPLYVVELLEALRDEGRFVSGDGVMDVTGSGMPPSLRLTIMRRLGALPEGTMRCLRYAAVLGDGVGPALLAEQVGTTPVGLSDLVEPAIRAGLLDAASDRVSFRHDLIRQALYDDMPALRRAALHAGAADGLARVGGDPATIAVHRAKGLRAGDVEPALDLLDHCATLLERAPAAVLAHVDAARAVLPAAHPGLLWASCLAADAAARTGAPEQAEALVRALGEEQIDAATRLGLWRTITVSRLLRGRAEPQGLRDHQRLAEQVEDDPGRRSTHLALIAYGWFLTQTPEGYGTAAALAEQVVSDADDEATRIWGLAVRSLSAVDIPSNRRAARAALDRSRSAGLQGSWAGIVAHAVFADAHANDATAVSEVQEVLSQALSAAERAGLVHVLPLLHYTAAKAAMHAGDFEEGRVQAQTVLRFDAAHGYGELAPQATQILGHIAISRGEEPPDLAGFPEVFEALLAVSRAGRLLAAGDHTGASELTGPAMSVLQHVPPQFALAWYHPVLGALAASGRTEQLEELTARIRSYVEEWGDEIGEATLAYAEALADPCPDLARAATAAAKRAMPVPWQLEATRLAGTIFDAHQMPEEADAALAHAREIAHGAGASQLVEEIDRLRATTADAATPRRPRLGWESITDAEARVLELVVEGLTYRAVGERLFVSRRTVETHVASIFNKVGVHSRNELVHRWMQRTHRSP